MKARTNYEQRFHVALKRILAYMTPDQLRRRSEKQYGLSFEESIEMAYENIQQEARNALHGYRAPKVKAALPLPPAPTPPESGK